MTTTHRWTRSEKEAVLRAIDAGRMTEEAAILLLRLSRSEIQEWRDRGDGLEVTYPENRLVRQPPLTEAHVRVLRALDRASPRRATIRGATLYDDRGRVLHRPRRGDPETVRAVALLVGRRFAAADGGWISITEGGDRALRALEKGVFE